MRDDSTPRVGLRVRSAVNRYFQESLLVVCEQPISPRRNDGTSASKSGRSVHAFLAVQLILEERVLVHRLTM